MLTKELQARKILNINRDILECKSWVRANIAQVRFILIETYWNVNADEAEYVDPALYILIETYWNVNVLTFRNTSLFLMILIETYWNVNEVPVTPVKPDFLY